MTTAEFSYDLVMEPDMHFVEGTYRLPGQEWHVFIFSRRPVDKPEWRMDRWESRVQGLVIAYPGAATLSKAMVEQVLSSATGVETWVTVRGPDSIHRR